MNDNYTVHVTDKFDCCFAKGEIDYYMTNRQKY